MNIRRIGLFRVVVPLKKIVKHASHTRVESENLVVRVELAAGRSAMARGSRDRTSRARRSIRRSRSWPGTIGPGSSAGRPTSPTWSGAWNRWFFRRSRPTLAAWPATPPGVRSSWPCSTPMAARSASRWAGPSSWRNVPGLRRHSLAPHGSLFGGDHGRVPAQGADSAIKFRLYGFRDVKIKVGVAGQDDVRRLKWIRRILGPRVDLRLDANEAWPAAELLERVAAAAAVLASRPWSSPFRMPRSTPWPTCGPGWECR